MTYILFSVLYKISIIKVSVKSKNEPIKEKISTYMLMNAGWNAY